MGGRNTIPTKRKRKKIENAQVQGEHKDDRYISIKRRANIKGGVQNWAGSLTRTVNQRSKRRKRDRPRKEREERGEKQGALLSSSSKKDYHSSSEEEEQQGLLAAETGR